MKKKTLLPLERKIKGKENLDSADFISPDTDSDKTQQDDNADGTVKKKRSAKSKLEIEPDTTGIDTKADKTKKEKFPKRK